MNKYEKGEHIRDIHLGNVFKVTNKATEEVLIMKELELTRELEWKRVSELFHELSHPKIIHCEESFVKDDKICIIMPCCDGGNLLSLIEEANTTKTKLKESHIMNLFVQILLGLNYLHSNNVVYRKLKPSKILLSNDGQVKLGHCSKAIVSKEPLTDMCGCPEYMPPEIYQGIPYGPKVDIWSLGCVLFELMELYPAFDSDESFGAIIMKIFSGSIPDMHDDWSDDIKNLVKLLLAVNPEERPTTNQLLDLDFVKKHMLPE
eukprot:TRINITY_DN1157_c0_g3_i1.p1 TRINITY_DN1157_c0_g3~~TRINITY_DN1157_c0_g3_i1.p1  ORF type:complete len:261 (+),score=47.03 TRINITY_DN1157_c0_g3_i1:247-1029(+)